jgi:hypothetical protein
MKKKLKLGTAIFLLVHSTSPHPILTVGALNCFVFFMASLSYREQESAGNWYYN